MFSFIEGTFDVQDINIDAVGDARVCLTVCLAQGSSSAKSFVKLKCTTGSAGDVTAIIEGNTGCVDGLSSCTYMLSVTDMDAADDIDTAPAISYHGLVVPLSPSSTTQLTPTFQYKCSSILPSTDETLPDGTLSISCSSTAIAALVSSGALLAVTLVLNIAITMLCLKCRTKQTSIQSNFCTEECF